jgi:hypothetical protein
MEDIFRGHNSAAISRQVSPGSLLDVSTGNFKRDLVDESSSEERRAADFYRS